MAKEKAELLLRIRQAGSKAIDRLRDAFSRLKFVAIAAFGAITAGVVKSVSAFKEQELSINKLNRSMVQQGTFTKELSKEYQQMAAELQKVTTFGDEATISAIAQLQAYVGQNKVTKELVQATQDLAAAQELDLNSAADLIGKTIGSTTNALTRYGVNGIDVTASKSEKLIQVQQGVNKMFGGFAEAQAEGLGALDQMKNAIGDTAEIIGKAFAPFVVDAAKDIKDFNEEIQKTDSTLNRLSSFAADSAIMIEKVRIEFVTLGKNIAGNLAGISSAISAVARGEFKLAAQIFKDIDEELIKEDERLRKESADKIAEIENLKLSQLEANLKKEEAMLRASNERKNSIAAEQSENENLFDFEKEQAKLEKEALHQAALTDLQFKAELERLNNKINMETDAVKRIELLRKRELLAEKKFNELKKANMTDLQKFIEFMDSKEVKQTQSSLGTISTLQQSHDKGLFEIGKAAAIANIVISTSRGVAKTLELGFPLGLILAPLVAAAGAVQLQKVQSQSLALADGGIVKATPGGVPAIIGEGGRDEAVIPLDDDRAAGLGANITINFTGPVMGDERQAREFAIMVDQEIFKARRENQTINQEAIF